MYAILLRLRDLLWGAPTILCILGTGVYFTVRSRFLQCRPGRILRGIRERDAKTNGTDGESPLRTLFAALGACMGTGNIAGVGAAVLTGGAGALLWMCVSAFFGMMTSFAETVLAVRFRQKDARGNWIGGAMVTLERGSGMRRTGQVYAFLLAVSSFGIGNMAQVRASASAMQTAFGVQPSVVSACFAFAVLLTVCGGVRRICSVTEKIVPILSVLFLLSALAAVALHIRAVPSALTQIVRDAFRFRAAAGGIVGQAVRVGVARGVFTNEAGLGSTAVIHAAADTRSPVRQGMWGIVEVFLDTVVMCTLTGLVLLTSGVELSGTDGAALYAKALSATVGKSGEALTAVTLALLGFASLVGWSYCGERGAAHLCGEKALPVYRILYAAAAFGAGFLPLDTVFLLSDVCNGLMAFPNLLSLWLLSGTVLREIKAYRSLSLCVY